MKENVTDEKALASVANVVCAHQPLWVIKSTDLSSFAFSRKETEMFDDKIGDVYRGGRKVGELRRRDDGCTGGLLVGLFLTAAVIIGLIFGALYLFGTVGVNV